jgi:hypothetical protein
MFKEASLVFDTAIKRCEGPFFAARESFMVYFLKTHQVDLALSHLEAAVSQVKDNEWRPTPAPHCLRLVPPICYLISLSPPFFSFFFFFSKQKHKQKKLKTTFTFILHQNIFSNKKTIDIL